MPHITGARAAGRDTAAACWLMVRRGYCKGPAGLADCCSRRTLQLKCCFARLAHALSADDVGLARSRLVSDRSRAPFARTPG